MKKKTRQHPLYTYMYRLIVVTKQKFQNGVVFCGQPPRTNQTAYMTFAVSLVKLPTEAVLNVFIYFTVIRFFPYQEMC